MEFIFMLRRVLLADLWRLPLRYKIEPNTETKHDDWKNPGFLPGRIPAVIDMDEGGGKLVKYGDLRMMTLAELILSVPLIQLHDHRFPLLFYLARYRILFNLLTMTY